MIYEVTASTVSLPYLDDGNLCLRLGLLNPESFTDGYKRHPWYPFWDYPFYNENIEKLLSLLEQDGDIFRQDMPCRGKTLKTYAICGANAIDAAQVSRWLSYDEGILWTTSGNLLINSYSDLVILAISETIWIDLIGAPGFEIYNDSSPHFMARHRHDTDLDRFMKGVQNTWPVSERRV